MEAALVENDPRLLRRTLVLFAETVLRPVIRMLLRYGLSYPEFNQVARKVYVDVAMQEAEFRMPRRRRQYKSRVALLTALSRKEVLHQLDLPRPGDNPDLRPCNRAARVLEGWLTDPRYTDNDGAPLVLPFRANNGRRSFVELVHDHSGDIPARAMLDELIRARVCVANDHHEIRVINRVYQSQYFDADALMAAAMRAAASLGRIDAQLAAPAVAPASGLVTLHRNY